MTGSCLSQIWCTSDPHLWENWATISPPKTGGESQSCLSDCVEIWYATWCSHWGLSNVW